MLAFVEHNFGLAPLTTADADAYDYSNSFDYSQTPLAPIHLTMHAVPRWEKRYIARHPANLADDPT